MRLVTTQTTAAAAIAALAVLIASSHAHAQTVTGLPAQELGLKTNGAPQGYAILKQVLTQGRLPEANVNLKPESTVPPPDTWTWTVNPGDDTQIKADASLRWYAQAACPDNLTNLQVSGPGGTLTQNPLFNPVSGYFKTQSFTVTTLKDVCVNWANDHKCDTVVPGEGCQLDYFVDLVGDVNPAGPADRLRLKASCGGGPVADLFYAPKLRLNCHR